MIGRILEKMSRRTFRIESGWESGLNQHWRIAVDAVRKFKIARGMLIAVTFWLLLPMAASAEGGAEAADEKTVQADIEAALALFEANLDAIRQRDRDAYLACYLRSDTLARSGPGGINLGYAGLEASAGSGWPDFFNAQNLNLVWLRPGVVYGTYRYRVRYGDQEVVGLSERVFMETPDGWRIAVTTAFPDPPGTAPPSIALVGGTLIDGTGAEPVANAVVIAEDGKIVCAGGPGDCRVPGGMQTVDLSGHWITPGLVDGHVHFSQTGWADGRPDSMDLRAIHPYPKVQQRLESQPEVFWRSYLCSGVTAVFDVGGYPWTWDLRRRASLDSRAPHIAAAGPLLSTLDFWLNLEGERQFIHLADAAAAENGVRYLASSGTDAVKVWFIPTRDKDKQSEFDAAVMAAGSATKERGVPMIAHATNLREAKVALQAGAHLLVHSVRDQPVDDEFLELARANGTFYNPTLIVGDGYWRMFESANAEDPPAIDDPNGCVDEATLQRVRSTAGLAKEHERLRMTEEQAEMFRQQIAGHEKVSAENLLKVHQAGIPIVMGTDAGNPLTLHGPSVYAEMEAMQAAGLTPMDVLIASTRNGALAMGKGDRIGTVEVGKIADLLVVAADPLADIANLRQVRYVMRGGEWRPLDELRAARSTEP